MSQDAATIMVIGDDSHFCYLMRRYVKKSMHRILFAYLGEDALTLAQREKPAAIVLEVDTPSTVGWDVLRALKADQDTHDIPVVLCSWSDEQEHGVGKGADAYLRKPILYEDFVAALVGIGIRSRL